MKVASGGPGRAPLLCETWGRGPADVSLDVLYVVALDPECVTTHRSCYRSHTVLRKCCDLTCFLQCVYRPARSKDALGLLGSDSAARPVGVADDLWDCAASVSADSVYTARTGGAGGSACMALFRCTHAESLNSPRMRVRKEEKASPPPGVSRWLCDKADPFRCFFAGVFLTHIEHPAEATLLRHRGGSACLSVRARPARTHDSLATPRTWCAHTPVCEILAPAVRVCSPLCSPQVAALPSDDRCCVAGLRDGTAVLLDSREPTQELGAPRSSHGRGRYGQGGGGSGSSGGGLPLGGLAGRAARLSSSVSALVPVGADRNAVIAATLAGGLCMLDLRSLSGAGFSHLKHPKAQKRSCLASWPPELTGDAHAACACGRSPRRGRAVALLKLPFSRPHSRPCAVILRQRRVP